MNLGMEKKWASPKTRRHLTVVGGTDTLPSLREVHHHRNVVKPKRSQSAKPAMTILNGQKRGSCQAESMTEEKRRLMCNLCVKMQSQWEESDGLRKKTPFSDVTVHSSDGEYFYCNAFVIGVWAKRLLDAAELKRSESGQEEWIINVDIFSGQILYSCLRLMYGGSIEEVPAKHLHEITNFANAYKMDDMKGLCLVAADTIPLKVENVCALWLFAHHFQLINAADRAMRFVYENLETLVNDRDWQTRIWRRPDMLMILLHASTCWTKPASSDWRSYKEKEEKKRFNNALSMGVHQIWQETNGLRRPYAYNNALIEAKAGHNFHVHTQIIFACSPRFAAFLHEEAEANDMPQVIMDDFDDDVVEEFLRFIYQQEPSADFKKLAPMVIVLAETYEVPDLISMCEREIAVQDLTSVEKALNMLREAEEHRMTAAKSVCFRYLYENLETVRTLEEWRCLIMDEPQLLAEMLLESKRFRVVDSK